ncbi:HEAT repeat domain-containing protein [Gemmatimonadota bacterium]
MLRILGYWLMFKFQLGTREERYEAVCDLAVVWEGYGRRAIRPLAVALRDPDPEIRRKAVRGLEEQFHEVFRSTGSIHVKESERTWAVHNVYKRAGAIKALRVALRDKTWEVRKDAAVVLGKVRGREAVAELIESLEQDPEWVVRYESAEALGRTGDPRAVEVLLAAALQDEHKDVRAQAKHGLALIDSDEAWQAYSRC